MHESVSLRTHVVQRAIRLLFKPVLALAPVNDTTLRTIRAFDALSARGPRSPFVEPVERELGGVRAESMTHRYGPRSEMTVLYLHGGAFLSCGIETHRRICERFAYLTGATVHSLDYVQLPEGTVAESVADAIGAYEALVAEAPDPRKIVVAGDSAGGYLSAKVAELATRRGLPAPAALVMFSPLLSLDPERGDKNVMRVRRPRDAYLPLRRIPQIRERWVPLDAASIEGFASPLHATRYISSPTFMTAVDDEILRPEVEAFALLLHERGVRVATHLWRNQVHAFPVMVDLFPEARLALRLAAEFARRQVGELDEPPTEDPDSHVETLVGELVEDSGIRAAAG